MTTRNNLQKFPLLAGAALLSTGALATPAGEPITTETEIVKYSVSESVTPVGARKLYGKLKAAATRVCSSSVPGTRIPFVDRACAADALTNAVADLGNPLVIALHSGMPGGERMAGALPAQAASSETLASR